MANGYCLPILNHIRDVALGDPARKLSPLGFTQMLLCCMDGSVTVLNDRYQNGHTRGMTIKYRERVPESAVNDADEGCSAALTPAYKEFNIGDLITRSISFYVPDSLIQQYCVDASQKVNLNGTGTTVMKEVYDMLIEYGGALLKSINTALVTQMSTQFGVNVSTGSADATALTIPSDDAMMRTVVAKLLKQWRDNEFCDDVCIAGSGPFADFDLIKDLFSNVSALGLDASKVANRLPQTWYDKSTASIWGADQIGVFEKGSLAFLTRNNNVASFKTRLANSEYFTMALPVNEYQCPQSCLDQLLFDVQIREIDCPQTMEINGVSQQVGRGVVITLTKEFSLFVKPSTLFPTGDDLAGTNGTLRYSISDAVETAPTEG